MRNFLLCIVVCLGALVCAPVWGDEGAATQPAIYVDHAGLLKLGWQLACVGSTFKDRSTFDMIDLLHSLNFHHIELSEEQFEALDPAGVDALVAKLKSVHMDVVSAGPLNLGASEADDRAIFETAKKLKLKTIVTNRAGEWLPLLDKLAGEYRINVAIRNSAKPGDYWDPEELRKAIEGLSNRVGVCVDVTAWENSDVSPVEAVQKLKGRILVVHLTGFAPAYVETVLMALKEQKFKGICAVECPAGDHLMERFTGEVNAFSKIVGDLSGVQ